MVPDQLWEEIKPLLPPHASRPRGGRPRSSDRAALECILCVLRNGIPWELLPAVFGVCGMTCWIRLRDWQATGVWNQLHERILAQLRKADKPNWVRACVDSTSVRATK
jgi:transposase